VAGDELAQEAWTTVVLILNATSCAEEAPFGHPHRRRVPVLLGKGLYEDGEGREVELEPSGVFLPAAVTSGLPCRVRRDASEQDRDGELRSRRRCVVVKCGNDSGRCGEHAEPERDHSPFVCSRLLLIELLPVPLSRAGNADGAHQFRAPVLHRGYLGDQGVSASFRTGLQQLELTLVPLLALAMLLRPFILGLPEHLRLLRHQGLDALRVALRSRCEVLCSCLKLGEPRLSRFLLLHAKLLSEGVDLGALRRQILRQRLHIGLRFLCALLYGSEALLRRPLKCPCRLLGRLLEVSTLGTGEPRG
jgi:hypothetical protein